MPQGTSSNHYKKDKIDIDIYNRKGCFMIKRENFVVFFLLSLFMCMQHSNLMAVRIVKRPKKPKVVVKPKPPEIVAPPEKPEVPVEEVTVAPEDLEQAQKQIKRLKKENKRLNQALKEEQEKRKEPEARVAPSVIGEKTIDSLRNHIVELHKRSNELEKLNRDLQDENRTLKTREVVE